MLKRFLILAAVLAIPAVGRADSLVPLRTIRSQEILSPSDVVLVKDSTPGSFSDPSEISGLEARVVLYQGRAIQRSDVGPPAIIGRNELVTLRFTNGSLSIATEGRSLGRAGVGDSLKVLNLASRNTVMGRVEADGTVVIGGHATR